MKRHGATVHATPFSHSRSNIDYARQLLDSEFKDMLRPDLLSYSERNNTTLCINSQYDCEPGLYEASVCNRFEFSHHDVIASEDARNSYGRKAQRFLDGPQNGGPICFVYHYRYHSARNVARIAEKLNAFGDAWGKRVGRRPSVAMFTQNIVTTKQGRGIDLQIINGVAVAVLRTQRTWGGVDQDQFWGRTDDDLFGRMIGAFEMYAINAHSAVAPRSFLDRWLARRRAA